MDYVESLRFFRAAVDAGSFTRAADALNVTAPAMSRAIASLEQRLGARLFNRTTRHILVTDTGAILYEQATKILKDIDVLEQAVLHQNQELAGALRIVAHASAAVEFLVPLLSSFKAAYPKVVLEITLIEGVVDLVADGYDLGLVLPYMLTTDTVVTQRLTRLRQIVVAAPRYLEERGIPRHPSELVEHGFVTASSSSKRTALTFYEGTERLTISLYNEVLTNSPLLRRLMVLNGVGISVLPESLVQDDLAKGLLVQVLSDFPLDLADIEIQLAYAQRTLQPAKVRKFIEHARSYYESLDPQSWFGANATNPGLLREGKTANNFV